MVKMLHNMHVLDIPWQVEKEARIYLTSIGQYSEDIFGNPKTREMESTLQGYLLCVARFGEMCFKTMPEDAE